MPKHRSDLRTLKRLQESKIDAWNEKRELARLEAKLERAEKAFEELHEFVPIGYLTLNRAGRILKVNRAAEELFGSPRRDLIGNSVVSFVSQEDIGTYIDHLLKAISTKHPVAIDIHLRLLGAYVPVRMTTIQRANDTGWVYQVAISDQSETVALQRELQESLQQWYSLVRHAPDVILLVNVHGRISFGNRDCFGKRAENLIGENMFDLLPQNNPALLENFRRALRDPAAFGFEVNGIRDNESRWYSVRLGTVPTPVQDLLDSRPVVPSIIVIVTDVTDQKCTEVELRSSSEQLRELSARIEQVREEERKRLAAEIHDELGQAMTALNMDLAWIEKRVSRRDKELSQRIDVMKKSLTTNIHTIRRIASDLRPTVLDDLGLAAALEWQLQEFQMRAGIPCKLNLNQQDLPLNAERSTAVFRFVQEALTNVARHSQATRVTVDVKQKDGHIIISVDDNGKGISTDQIKRPDSLGLVGMRERVTRLGGDFSIETNSGSGTRLSVRMPASLK
jgi:PAS domain S-box-containing protein